MRANVQRFPAVGLALYLLLFGVVVSPQLTAHAGHHAHHQNATHSTALCAWLCSADQGLHWNDVVLSMAILTSDGLWQPVPQFIVEFTGLTALSRGPPYSLTSR